MENNNSEKLNKINHSKFYEGDKDILNIRNNNEIVEKDEENPFEQFSAVDFMTGSCDIFSVCLNEKFDYKIYKIIQKKEVHYFCFSEIDKIKYYIDVRGFTNSFNEFVNFYRMPKNGEIKKVSKSEINETKRQKYYLDGERFAKKIINENINNYFIKKNIE